MSCTRLSKTYGRTPATNVSWSARSPQRRPACLLTRDKLAQVIRNLITNAVKYSPEGGEVTVGASHEPDKERVVVEVRDRGMGISPENLDMLFSSFVRIRRPETEGIRGTGLGLGIVKGLVSLIGGRGLGKVGARQGLDVLLHSAD